jgi:hypothetical protein
MVVVSLLDASTKFTVQALLIIQKMSSRFLQQHFVRFATDLPTHELMRDVRPSSGKVFYRPPQRRLPSFQSRVVIHNLTTGQILRTTFDVSPPFKSVE